MNATSFHQRAHQEQPTASHEIQTFGRSLMHQNVASAKIPIVQLLPDAHPLVKEKASTGSIRRVLDTARTNSDTDAALSNAEGFQ